MKTPKVDHIEVDGLIYALSHGRWATAKELAQIASERRLRAIANASRGRIIGGQLGYKLSALATIDEIKHACNWLRHQARLMMDRANEIETAKETL